MTAWLVIVAVGVGTYALRAVTFAVVGARGLPAWTHRSFAYVGPAAIGALVGGMLLSEHGHVDLPGLAEGAAAAASFLTVRRTGNVAHGLGIGFAVLWGLAWLTG
jgi:branched-subunit amino acid transport protein